MSGMVALSGAAVTGDLHLAQASDDPMTRLRQRLDDGKDVGNTVEFDGNETDNSDPMDRLRKRVTSPERADQSAPADQPETQVESPQPAPDSAPSPQQAAQVINIYCSGTIDRFTGPLKVGALPFEFRTIVDLTNKSHRVVSVIQGPLFQQGATYTINGPSDQIVVLQAESTRGHWKISNVNLDLATSRLSGNGAVDISSIVGMRTKAPRSVKVDGQCQAV